jgi:hypothetical protein
MRAVQSLRATSSLSESAGSLLRTGCIVRAGRREACFAQAASFGLAVYALLKEQFAPWALVQIGAQARVPAPAVNTAVNYVLAACVRVGDNFAQAP